MAEIAISLPFRLDAYGNVAATYDYSKVWADRVLSVVGTLVGERVMNGDFGTYLATYLHENLEGNDAAIEKEVETAFSKWLPLLTLLDTKVTSDASEASLSVEITYQLPNDEEQNTVVALSAISRNLPIYQENL
jgi:phage baseplate assembly protein W